MTINIALVTYEGIILGCDSLSSIVETALFPFRNGEPQFLKDSEGNLVRDADGNAMLPYKQDMVSPVAVTVFGGVSKMFCLYEDDDTSVAAVTAGMVILGGVTIAEQAKRYKRTQEDKKFTSVEAVANSFKEFIAQQWEKDFAKSGRPDSQRMNLTIQFLIAGFGAEDEYGKVFRVDVASNLVQEQFDDSDDHSGICWGGSADYVERLLKGVDSSLQFTVGRELVAAMAAQRATTINDLSDALVKAQVVLPDDMDLHITEEQPPTLPWDSVKADIDYGNLSTQYAVELVELLVNTQSGMQRFARGIPVVGGRTHIGVLKRGEKLQLLNAPKLQHKHTGYADDF